MSVQDHAVFDFSSKVVDYRIIQTSTGDAGSLVVLCEEELVVIDLVTPKWPSYRESSSFTWVFSPGTILFDTSQRVNENL